MLLLRYAATGKQAQYGVWLDIAGAAGPATACHLRLCARVGGVTLAGVAGTMRHDARF
jgi:hypothetical protein